MNKQPCLTYKYYKISFLVLLRLFLGVEQLLNDSSGHLAARFCINCIAFLWWQGIFSGFCRKCCVGGKMRPRLMQQMCWNLLYRADCGANCCLSCWIGDLQADLGAGCPRNDAVCQWDWERCCSWGKKGQEALSEAFSTLHFQTWGLSATTAAFLYPLLVLSLV